MGDDRALLNSEYINEVHYKGKLLLDDTLRYSRIGLAVFNFKIEIAKATRKLLIQCVFYGEEAENFKKMIDTGINKNGRVIEVWGSTNDYIKTTSNNKKYVYSEAHIKKYELL